MEELKAYYPYIIALLVGTILPATLALIFPRHLTVRYGMALYRFVGHIMAQKRASLLKVNGDALSRLLYVVRTTFVDLSFGVYIASRGDFSDKDREEKIKEYLDRKPASDISDGGQP